MKKQFILFTLLTVILNAQNITLTPEQEKNWEIKVEMAQTSQKIPLGEFMAKVITPPTLLHTISLPFEANVKKLHVANYQEVKEGEILADVTGTAWIETQQKAISDAMTLKYHEHLAKRKNMLCKEEIIPQKECIASNAELEADKIKIAASKALLKSYGASDEMIIHLLKDFTLSPTIPLRSTVDGHIVNLNAAPGKSTSPEDALFVIKQKGSLWLESAIEVERTQELKRGEKVQIILGNTIFDTSIIQLSPVINPDNQTRQVHFLVPTHINILSGLRSNVKIIFEKESLKIRKNSVIKIDETPVVFYKTKEGYTSLPIEILAEDDLYYFVKPTPLLKNKIAVTSVAILKNMLGSKDE